MKRMDLLYLFAIFKVLINNLHMHFYSGLMYKLFAKENDSFLRGGFLIQVVIKTNFCHNKNIIGNRGSRLGKIISSPG